MSYAFKLAQNLSQNWKPIAILAAAALAACEVSQTAAPPTDRAVAQVVITPDSVDIAPGATAQFAAFGRTAQGDTVSVAVTWSASGGSITSAGLYTADTSAGTFSISAQTTQAVHGSAKVHVGNGQSKVASVAVSPATASIAVGATQVFTAVLQDARGNVITGRSVTGTSSAPAIGSISATGVVTGLLAGTTTITATSEGKSGTASLTVTVAPPPTSGSWPNQPSGLNLLSDQPWTSLGSWQLNDNTAGNTSLVTLSGLPFSPSGALQDLSPIGMTGRTL